MQRGFATLEIIFAAMIIAVLMSCTIPNVERVIDRVALDYETKRTLTTNFFVEDVLNMQRGFATLEIIFAAMIIAVLMSCTIPNVERVIDRVALDYETKRTLTTNFFAKDVFIMQRGFATLEIIFAAMIIAVLATCTIPNVERVIDRVALDYETKRLYSELRFLQAINRSGTFNTAGIGRNDFGKSDAPFMKIAPENYSYQILRGNTAIRAAHHMQHIRKISSPTNRITFDDTGQSKVNGSIILTSRLDKKSSIVFDSVGRIRGGRDNE